ncbi:hypothetical protein Lal_00007469 [Lupinus albus]|uniref:Putative encoded peptide n=1 Tax=Lupinus albus TaxID=3870 RepID=A0A6A4NWB3_LUPAL|nr:putative encoded peptide [Lupinus albus]KAE9596658.1 putative encoded peptide [Lupinus albus]KAF1874854.1 hypothetical protein Lal_00007469 [Lupinus albus]
MSNTNQIKLACVFLLFLILHQQDLYVQGRNLRSHRLCRGCSKTHRNMKNMAAYGGGGGVHGSNANDPVVHKETRRRRKEYEVDGFRPTSPGHSPGVGHSINN